MGDCCRLIQCDRYNGAINIGSFIDTRIEDTLRTQIHKDNMDMTSTRWSEQYVASLSLVSFQTQLAWWEHEVHC